MTETVIGVALGLTHGAVLLPSSFYLATLVQADLSKRHAIKGGALSGLAAFSVLIGFIGLSSLAVSELLDLCIPHEHRRHAARIAATSTFIGLVLFVFGKILAIRIWGTRAE